jgi:hypothetical protein
LTDLLAHAVAFHRHRSRVANLGEATTLVW